MFVNKKFRHQAIFSSLFTDEISSDKVFQKPYKDYQLIVNNQERAPNCSVIIVGTFLDEAENKRKNYVEDMRKEIYKRFVSTKCGGNVPDLAKKGLPKVVQVIEVNSKSQRSVARVRQLVYDTVMALKANKNSEYSSLFHPFLTRD